MNQAEGLAMFSKVAAVIHKEELLDRVAKLNVVVQAHNPFDVVFDVKENTTKEVDTAGSMNPVTEDMILYAMMKLEEELKLYSYGDPMIMMIQRDMKLIDELVRHRSTLRKLGEVFE